MKISTKIALGFGILVVLVLVTGIFAITGFSHSSSLFNKMDTVTMPKWTAVGEMNQKVAAAHVDFMEFLLSGKLSARDNVAGIIRNLENLAQPWHVCTKQYRPGRCSGTRLSYTNTNTR